MMFHNRDTSAAPARRPIPPLREVLAAVVVTACLLSSAHARIHSRASFPVTGNNVTDSGVILDGGALALSVARTQTVKIFGDSCPATNRLFESFYPAISAFGGDTTFACFWADSLGVYKRDYRINVNRAVPLADPAKIGNFTFWNRCYLHGNRGENDFLVSYFSGGKYLRIVNGTRQFNLDSTFQSETFFPAQCYAEKDTYCLVYADGFTQITLAKVYARGNDIRLVNTVIAATGRVLNGECLLNPSVAADSDGNVLVTWLKGGLTVPKNLYYRVFDRNLSPVAVEAIAAFGIAKSDSMFYDDNAPAASYGRGRFAILSWDAAGVQLHRVRLNGGLVTATTDRVLSQTNVRFTAIAAHPRYLLATFKRKAAGVWRTEAYRYPLADGEPVLADSVYIRCSDSLTSTADTTYDERRGSGLSCTLDSAGSFAFAWRQKPNVKICILSKRPIRFSRGFWVSPVESLSIAAGDSVRFYPPRVTISDLSSWFLQDSIRVGCGAPDFNSSNPWTSLSSGAVLSAFITGCRYFQYRLTINRKPGADSLGSPGVSAIALPWNAKPIVATLDSIAVNGRIRQGARFGDTITITSRRDTLSAFIGLHDADSTGTLTIRNSGTVVDSQLTCASLPEVHVRVRYPEIMASDTVVACSTAVTDTFGWSSDPRIFYLRSRNKAPQFTVSVEYRAADGSRATAALTDFRRFIIQEDDSVACIYSIADTNDPAGVRAILYRTTNGVRVALDSIQGGAQKRYVIRGPTVPVADSTVIEIDGHDPDTTVTRRASVVVNHMPRISGVRLDGRAVNAGDSMRVSIGRPGTFSVTARDTDLAFWDSLTCVLSTPARRDSVKKNSGDFTWTFVPSRSDTQVVISTHDRYGKKDSILFYIKYPWLSVDTATNAVYRAALDSLDTLFSLILGGPVRRDSVTVPILNGGSDSLHLTSIKLADSTRAWLSLRAPQPAGTAVFSAANASSFVPVVLNAGSTARLVIYACADSLSGDGMLSSSIVIGTSDLAHPFDTVPLRLEYNDLPRVLSVAPQWDSTRPYQRAGLYKAKASAAYRFPPHASIGIDFSEPMDTATARTGLFVYSVFDSAAARAVRPISVRRTWNKDFSRLTLTAQYDTSSRHFALRPPSGLFVPTDSLVLVLTSALTDRAITLHGPNRLDVNDDFNRDPAGDERFLFRVDSITFSLLAVSPPDGDTAAGPTGPIVLTFSAPVLKSAIDTARINNRSLIVRSRCNGGNRIAFDSVVASGSSVRFYPKVRFFFHDSVSCYYRGASIRDRIGFPADNRHSGIPATLFDTASTAEDVQWRFSVKGIAVLSVTPRNGDTTTAANEPITISFSEKVPADVFDISLTGNRSFKISSRYGEGDQSTFRSVFFSRDSTAVTFVPASGYFNNDSVHCSFFGFSKKYRYGETVFPGSADSGSAGFEWFFRTGSTGFYTYPNPYKPGKDPRHCRDNGPCGIWFKNLHSLEKGAIDFRVCIYSIKGWPVFDSKKAGVTIRLNPGDKPQWLWNTNNDKGEPVASGIYFYSIFDGNDKVLLKAKLMIVR